VTSDTHKSLYAESGFVQDYEKLRYF